MSQIPIVFLKIILPKLPMQYLLSNAFLFPKFSHRGLEWVGCGCCVQLTIEGKLLELSLEISSFQFSFL